MGTSNNMKIIIVLSIALALAGAKPQKGAGGSRKAEIEKWMEDKSFDEIKAEVDKTNADINEVSDYLKGLEGKPLFEMKDGQIEATELGMEAFKDGESFMKEVEDDLKDLPPLPEEGEDVFINGCIEASNKYDYNTAKDEADFANTLIGHVMECALVGIEILEGLSDTSEWSEDDVDLAEVEAGIELAENTAVELGQLVKFMESKFEKAVKEGFGDDFNKFVKGEKKRSFLTVLKQRKLRASLRALLN